MIFDDVKQKEVDIFTHPKMQEQQAIKKLLNACSDELKKGYTGGHVRDDKTLVLFFKHNAFTHEFTLKYKEILQKMREIYKKENLAGAIFFTKVEAKVAFVKDTSATLSNQEKYAERSSGNFHIGCEDEKIRSLFEDIQNIIKTKVENEQV